MTTGRDEPAAGPVRTTSPRGDERSRLRAAALSGFVCPGAGQIHNRAWVRGLLLVAATLWLAGLMLVRTLSAVIDALPTDPAAFDPSAAWQLSWEILERNRSALVPVTTGLLVLWLLGIADAWLGSPSPWRRHPLPRPPEEP